MNTDLADIRDPDAVRITIDTKEIAERKRLRELNERLRQSRKGAQWEST